MFILDKFLGGFSSILKLSTTILTGIKGFVRSKRGQIINNAKIFVKGINKPVKTTERGEFWRLLRPGQYLIKAEDDQGNYCEYKDVNVTSEVQVMDFVLDKSRYQNSGNFLKINIFVYIFYLTMTI